MLYISLLLSLLTFHAVYGQTDSIPAWQYVPDDPSQEAPPSMWFTLGWGTGSPGYAAVLLSFANEIEKHQLLTGRFTTIFGDAAGRTPPESYYDFSALYGYSNDNMLWFINVSAGLSIIIYNQRVFHHQDVSGVFPKDVYAIKSHVIAGIPFQFQVYSRFSKTSDAGLGFNLGGNINRVQPAFILTLSLTLGIYQ